MPWLINNWFSSDLIVLMFSIFDILLIKILIL